MMPARVSAGVVRLTFRPDTSIRVDWSENEVADLDFYRGEAYSTFFDHLDHDGGFYYDVCLVICQVPASMLIVVLALGRLRDS